MPGCIISTDIGGKVKENIYNFLPFISNYSLSSLRMRAWALVRRIDNCCALSTIAFLFLDETVWAISPQYFLFCIMRTSSSCTQDNRNPVSNFTSSQMIVMHKKAHLNIVYKELSESSG